MNVSFCLPGATFAREFLVSWTKLMMDPRWKGHQSLVHTGYNSSVLHCRNELLEVEGGHGKKDAKPFGGPNVEPYDYMMWIDSDIAFEPDDFFKLLAEEKPIISGLVPMTETGLGPYGKVNGFSPVGYLNLRAIPEDEEPFEVEFTGFAFLLVQRGVFESMDYPWFRWRTYNAKDRVVHPSEDFEWSIRARELGWPIYVHPGVRLGHVKKMVWRA